MVSPDPHFKDYEKRMYVLNRWVYFPANSLVNRRGWDRPCCYALYGDGVLLYIGQTNNFRHRLAQHNFQEEDGLYRTPWGVFKWIYAKAYFPKAYGFEAMLEKRLIKRLKPKGNRYNLSGNHYGRSAKQRKERNSAPVERLAL